MGKGQRHQDRTTVCPPREPSPPSHSALDWYYGSATRRHALAPHVLYGLFTAGSLVLAVWRHLPRMPGYSSFIAGASTFTGENPGRNALAAALFIFGSLSGLFCCQAATAYLERNSNSDVIAAVAPLFWIALMPDALFVSFQVIRPELWFGWLQLGFGMKAMLLLGIACLAQRGPSLRPDSARRVLELVAAAVILAGAGVLSATAAFSRISPASTPVPLALSPVAAGLTCFALMWAVVSMRNAATLESLCVGAAFLWQVPLALGVIVVYPASFAVRQSIAKPALLAFLLAAFVVAAWASLIWRYQKWRKSCVSEAHSLDRVLAPLCLAAILVLAVHEPLAGLPQMNPDDYHFGELLLPYQQFSQFGRIPFADLNYPHGLWMWLGGAANAVFFSGTGETSLAGVDLVNIAASVVFFLFMTVQRRLG